MLPFFTWLRELSLSGSAGNAAAWALVLLASALPLVPAILLLLRRRRWTDALLLLLPPTIFAALYFGVNPTLAGPVGQFLPVAALGCAAGHFRAPGPGKPFAMYHPLCVSQAPAYFGLAFD